MKWFACKKICNWDVVHSACIILLWSYILSYVLLPLGYLLNGNSQFGLFVFFSILGLIILRIRIVLKVDPKGKVVLITGCDTGFGHKLALQLHQKGFTVVAACLDSESDGAKELVGVSSDRIHVIQINVTSDHDVEEAVRYVKNLVQDKGLWSVVNNAGIIITGLSEWLTMEDYEKVMSINAMGVIRVTKAFLPLIRKAKGRVINVTSLSGQVASIMTSAYNASKFAVEGFSDSLRLEMRHFGVNVVLIEPGNFMSQTSIIAKDKLENIMVNKWNSISSDLKQDYTETHPFNIMDMKNLMEAYESKDMSLVINAMESAVCQSFPQARYQPSNAAGKMTMWLSPLLPELVFDWLTEFSYTIGPFLIRK